MHTHMHTYTHTITHTDVRAETILRIQACTGLWPACTWFKNYGTAQFKLDRRLVHHVLDTTHFSFHTHASIRLHSGLRTSNSPWKALAYALDVCTGKVCKKWTEEAMKNAVEAVGDIGGEEETILSVRGAAKRFNVPVETLRRRIIGLVDMDCRPGPRPVFSKREKEKLSNYCIQMADMYFSLLKEVVMHSTFLLAEKSGLKHPFKNGKAGRAWFEGFLSRNPQLSIHQTLSFSVARTASANKETVTDFLVSLDSCMQNLTSLPSQC